MDLPESIESTLSLVNQSKRTDVIKLYETLHAVQPSTAELATKQLVEIALEFKKACKFIELPNGTNPIQKLNRGKKVNKQIYKKTGELLKIIEDANATELLPLNTEMYQLISQAYPKQCTCETDVEGQLSIKHFLQLLKNATESVDSNCFKKQDSTNKDRSVAAYNVARVLKETVGVKVTKTPSSDYDSKKSKPTTAVFSRVLQMTLGLVGDYSYDQQELIASGLKLLNDDTIPHKKV